MYVFRALRERQLRPLLEERRSFLQSAWTVEAIRHWQLDRFNEQWRWLRQSVPYWRELSGAREIEQFMSWSQVADVLPVMDRGMVQTQLLALTDRRHEPVAWRSTGGTTARPLRFPVWDNELMVASQDMWFARGWFGITPSDRLFMIWGHSHALGSGFSGRIAAARRRVSDMLLGYCRWSAYELSEQALQRAADALIAYRPSYLIAYSAALDRFARVNRDRHRDFHGLGLKAAISTAESFPFEDSQRLVADVLGCRVVMEYGSVETGPLAYQGPDGRYSAFWWHYFFEAQESAQLPGTYELLVTSLFPRALPLIRYRIGDLITENPSAPDWDHRFQNVIGRCNDFITLPDGRIIHSEAISHAVKEMSGIRAYQMVQTARGELRLCYESSEPLQPGELRVLQQRLCRVNPQLAMVPLERVSQIGHTPLGKRVAVSRQ